MVNLAIPFLMILLSTPTDIPTGSVGHGTGGFSVDQRGKFVFYKSAAWPEEVRFDRASEALMDFFQIKGNEATQIHAKRLESKGCIPLKKHAGIGNHVAGEIRYTFVLEDNGTDFSYWFTDLSYQPYRNDRYGKRIKATATPIPLEKQMSKINQPVWMQQKAYAYESIAELADQLAEQVRSADASKVIHLNVY